MKSMTAEQRNHMLLCDPVSSVIPKMAVPTIISMLITNIYNMADTFFVSQIGTSASGAVGVIFSAMAIIQAISFMIGMGSGTHVSQALGAGNKKKADTYASTAFFTAFIAGIILAFFSLTNIDAVVRFLGSTETIAPYAKDYATYIFYAMPFMMCSFVMNNLLRFEGLTMYGMVGITTGGILNMVLDPILIFALNMGTAGAALATGIGQCIGGVVPAVYILRQKDLPLRFAPFKFEASPILHACTNGSSEFMSNISTSFVSMLYNMQLLRMLGEDGVSAYGVLMYVQLIFIGTAIGYSIGCAPIVSYHYGAGHHDELKNMLKKSLTLMGITGVALTMLALGLAAPLAKIFVGYDEGLLNLTRHAFSIFSFSFLLSGLNIFASGFFTALNNGLISAVISFARTLVFQAACVLLLPAMFGVDGIWYATLVAEGLTCLLSLWLIDRKKHFYHYDK